MATINNFLQQGVEQIRQSISDIDDSYNNDWDILAELIQNSVDGIRKCGKTDGKIEVIFNCQELTITVKDNGVGIPPAKLPKLLSMFGTDKKNDEKSIGEKGVGLKFVMFACNDFYIKSRTADGAAEAYIKDAFQWKNSSSEDFLSLDYNNITTDFEGTEVRLKQMSELPIFQLTFPQLKYVLRTKTAVGNTDCIWDEDIDISVYVTFVSQDGRSETEKVPFKYWLPIEGTSANDKISMTEYEDYIKIDRTDVQKRLMLKNKVIYKQKVFNHSGRSIKAFVCLVPQRKIWEVISTSFGLATKEQIADGIWMDKFAYATFQPGVLTSVKGMPTGISMEPPHTGSAGSWPQIFMLFEDRKLKFDIGRKSIHGKQKGIYNVYARELFNEFNRLSKYISGDYTPDSSNWDRDIVFNEIDTLIDIKSDQTNFVKTPKDQEGSVAAIFFECIGSKKITQITPLLAGYKNKYDLYALWGSKRVVIEFKATLLSIIKDFNDEVKMFTEINCIVCWGVTEDDEQAFSDNGIILEKIPPDGIINMNKEKFPHSTHTLRYSGINQPIYIIDMKSILGIA